MYGTFLVHFYVIIVYKSDIIRSFKILSKCGVNCETKITNPIMQKSS